ncbi:MAG TPA: serine hydrolase domain-containing protein [Cyclobacteriaceae bacterium]
MKKYPILLPFFALLLLSCTLKKEPVSVSLSDRLDSLLVQEFGVGGPGGAVLIMKNDSTIFSRGYGMADLETKELITPKTLFNLGSISKTFVANGILLLQQNGKLSVEDNLIKYFPDFKNKKIGEKIKIKHLLTHTSGLPDNRQVGKDTVFYLSAKDAENWAPELKVDSLEFEPGTNYHYSNPAYNGLALIIEKVSGQKWQNFISENIFKPSGMNTSTITDGPHPTSGVAHCYEKIQNEWKQDDYGEEPTFAAAGNGGIWSSIEELALYEKAIRSSTFLNDASIADSQTPKNDFPVRDLSSLENQSWNIGWSWFISKTEDGLKLVGHAGTQGGFYANYISIPEKKILFVLLSNFPADREKISTRVMAWLKEENYFDSKKK